MANPVVHFEIMGKDVAKLSAFYGKLFGWSISNMAVPDGGAYGFVEAAPRGIGGGIGASAGPGAVTFYIEVDDPAAYLARIEAEGGSVVVPVTTIPNVVTFARFADPEGHMVGLVKSE